MCTTRALVFLTLVYVVALAATQRSNATWLTLNGDAPLVVARGGFSGLFPDSSSSAYVFAGAVSLPNTVLFCDVQLTADGAGICFPDLRLENSSNIVNFYPDAASTYLLNGVSTKGWFSVDFSFQDLFNVSLTQGIYSRSDKFNGNNLIILAVEDVAGLNPPGLWLNIQHDAFYTQRNLSMKSYVEYITRTVVVNYISSPEVNFLKNITSGLNPLVTKLVFRFMQQADIEPTTNLTYGSLLGNLTFIKTFASGILVPKSYIWPVDESLYLLPYTSVVSDAHRVGLEVFAADFVNDSPFSYNYSYDPVAEYLSFIDNGNFSVDGVLSDFPITPSAAIDCYAHLGTNSSGQATPLIISNNGASGDFPGCTDLAYLKAITDGVDILDCTVQMTKDKVPVCLSSINLMEYTNVVQSTFSSLIKSIPEINAGVPGIFTFDLAWSDIQTLTPQILNPYPNYSLLRNPKNRNAGIFMTLFDFLTMTTNASSVSGVLINIENAAFLATNQSTSVTDAIHVALNATGYDRTTIKKVMIQSTNSSVLMKFKDVNAYEIVYNIDETIRDALNSTIEDIKSFADSVVVKKSSVYRTSEAFLTGVANNIVPKLHAYKLPVYVRLFRNEFVSQSWDFFSDATVEINSFVKGSSIDGVITDFPKTAALYRRNRCLSYNITPPYMQPVQPGALLAQIATDIPPAQAPSPMLSDPDVTEPPLPSASAGIAPSPDSPVESDLAPPPPNNNGQPKNSAFTFLPMFAMFLVSTMLLIPTTLLA